MKREKSQSKRASNARSLAAKRGWKTRRANAQARSERAKRSWRTRRANARARQLLAIEDLLGEDFETLAEASKALEELQQNIVIKSIAEWEALDFDETEAIEIAGNADY